MTKFNISQNNNFGNNYSLRMNKVFILIVISCFISGCTLRKEGGSWAVKKTIVDEVQESIQDTKELASDVSDANQDLSEKKNEQQVLPVANPENKPPVNSDVPVPSSSTKELKNRKKTKNTIDKYPK